MPTDATNALTIIALAPFAILLTPAIVKALGLVIDILVGSIRLLHTR